MIHVVPELLEEVVDCVEVLDVKIVEVPEVELEVGVLEAEELKLLEVREVEGVELEKELAVVLGLVPLDGLELPVDEPDVELVVLTEPVLAPDVVEDVRVVDERVLDEDDIVLMELLVYVGVAVKLDVLESADELDERTTFAEEDEEVSPGLLVEASPVVVVARELEEDCPAVVLEDVLAAVEAGLSVMLG